jgi:predicted permease
MVGRAIYLGGNPVTVVGVLQKGFLLNHEVMSTVAGSDHIDIIQPLPLAADAQQRRLDENYNLVARLKPGVTMSQAQADISVIAAHIREKDKRDRSFTISVVPMLDQVVGNVRRALLVLLGSVALVLLIACANVANLLLSRATSREKEVAIRTALGAGRGRLIGQLLTEVVMLSLAGGAGGLLIAQWSLRVVHAINPGNIPRLEAIGIDARVLAFTFAVSLLTGIIFGAAPAFRVANVDLNTSLKTGGRSSQSAGGLSTARHRLRGLLVVSELALSLVLLIGAGLLIRSFVRLQAVPPGFNPDRVISMRVSASGVTYRSDLARVQLFQQIGERIAALPGVEAQGGVTVLPFTSSVGWGGISVEGFAPRPGEELQVDLRDATPGYFHAMQTPLLQGRFFSDHDTLDAPPVVMIDAKFAQRFWPHENPIGKHVWQDPKKPLTIVGVVATVKQYGLDTDGKIVVYFPQSQDAPGWIFLVARTSSDPAGLVGAITREIHAVDRNAPVDDIETMHGRLYDSLARQRFSTTMLAAFAVFALILAVVGVYGVISFLVTQGTHDIGLRIALGAQRRDILGLVVRRGMTLAGAGIALGSIGALALTRLMSSLLFGVSAIDGLTFCAVALLLASTALVASYVPALRATRVDPVVALREE